MEIDTLYATILSGNTDLLVEHAVDASGLTVVELGSDPIKVKSRGKPVW